MHKWFKWTLKSEKQRCGEHWKCFFVSPPPSITTSLPGPGKKTNQRLQRLSKIYSLLNTSEQTCSFSTVGSRAPVVWSFLLRLAVVCDRLMRTLIKGWVLQIQWDVDFQYFQPLLNQKSTNSRQDLNILNLPNSVAKQISFQNLLKRGES